MLRGFLELVLVPCCGIVGEYDGCLAYDITETKKRDIQEEFYENGITPKRIAEYCCCFVVCTFWTGAGCEWRKRTRLDCRPSSEIC